MIWSWSTPAGPTCPGATAFCLSTCYVRGHGGHFASPWIQARYKANDRARRRPDFVPNIYREIRENGISVVRINVSGDFDTAAYIRRWHAIAGPPARDDLLRLYPELAGP